MAKRRSGGPVITTIIAAVGPIVTVIHLIVA
jgi:hypothetical protein